MIELPIYLVVVVLALLGAVAYMLGRATAPSVATPEDIDGLEDIICARLDLVADMAHGLAHLDQPEVGSDMLDPLGQLGGRSYVDTLHDRYRASEGARLTRQPS